MPTVKNCKSCGEPFVQYNTLQKHCVPCAIIEAKEKQKKKANKDWKVRKKNMANNLKTRTQKINEARVIYQRYIRFRDRNLPCISCGTLNASKWDAGHYLKAELYTGLIFNEDNTFRQCSRCNTYGQGMQVEYRMELIKRIGEQRVLTLEAASDSLRTYQWSDEELNEIKKKYKSLLILK